MGDGCGVDARLCAHVAAGRRVLLAPNGPPPAPLTADPFAPPFFVLTLISEDATRPRTWSGCGHTIAEALDRAELERGHRR